MREYAQELANAVLVFAAGCLLLGYALAFNELVMWIAGGR